MRKTILILPLFLFTYQLYSQEDVLLKRFKYRINNYREINFNTGGGGQVYNRELGLGDHNSNSSSGYLDANYQQIKSTDKILLNISGSAGSNINAGKSKNISDYNKSRGLFVSSNFSTLNKWFTRNFFTELGADLSAADRVNKYSSTNPNTFGKTKQYDYSITIHLGIGKGRLENITDMQNALWLYRALQEEKKLSRSLSDDELDELGHTITSAKNTRVLDARKRTQFMLETTDKFFQEKNILTGNDIRYFSSLNDILFFAINMPRLSGKELYVRLVPALNYARQNEIYDPLSTKNEDKIRAQSVMLSAGINKYIPASLRHQNNYGASVMLDCISYTDANKFFTSGTLTSQFDINSTIEQAGVKLFYQHAIYPNTRTLISFDLQSEGGLRGITQKSGFFGLVNLLGSFNYFISYRTRFTCNLGAGYQTNMYRYNYYHQLELMPDLLNLYANAGLQVSL